MSPSGGGYNIIRTASSYAVSTSDNLTEYGKAIIKVIDLAPSNNSISISAVVTNQPYITTQVAKLLQKSIPRKTLLELNALEIIGLIGSEPISKTTTHGTVKKYYLTDDGRAYLKTLKAQESLQHHKKPAPPAP